MKKISLFIKLLLILILMISTKTSFSQVTSNPLQKETLMPIPSWVKEGVCLVYKTEVGGRVGAGAESSAATLMGYSIYIVTSIQGNKVYGFRYDILSTMRGEWSINSKFTLLNTPASGFYLHPKLVEQALRDRALYAQSGIIVEGGPIGKDLYYFAVTTRTQDEITTTMDQFNSEGIIQKSTITRKNPNGAEAGNRVLMGMYNVSLPKGLTLPQIARTSVSYYYSSIIMGMASPMGTTSFRFIGEEGKIANYETISNMGYGTSTGRTVGDVYFGPFYINPILLRKTPIISIPQIGFSMNTAGYGQMGGILVTISISGQPVAQYEFDPNTGLLLNGSFYYTGNIIYFEVQK